MPNRTDSDWAVLALADALSRTPILKTAEEITAAGVDLPDAVKDALVDCLEAQTRLGQALDPIVEGLANSSARSATHGGTISLAESTLADAGDQATRVHAWYGNDLSKIMEDINVRFAAREITAISHQRNDNTSQWTVVFAYR